jgi:hypothetical protein
MSNMAKTDTREPVTEVIPVTTMVEVPVLSDAERAELVASLQEAEAEIREGRTKAMTSD